MRWIQEEKREMGGGGKREREKGRNRENARLDSVYACFFVEKFAYVRLCVCECVVMREIKRGVVRVI